MKTKLFKFLIAIGLFLSLSGIAYAQSSSLWIFTGTALRPVLTTWNVLVSKLIGGTATTSDLTLQTTSGVGATGADMHFLVGNNGATEAMTILNAGNVGIGTTVPQGLLDVQGVAGAPGVLYLATKELTVVDGDKLGQINFNAPLESDGFDAILVAGSIWSEADATFSTTVNTADLVFATAVSETATEKMRLTSAGNLILGGGTVAAEFRLLEPSGSGTNYTAFKAVAQAADITYSLPPTVGGAGTFLKDVAGDGVLTWATPAGSGDVSKVGTPVNNQVGVWTGDGTLEGDAALTYDATTDTLTSVTFAGALTGIASGNALPALSNLASVAINTTLVSDTDNIDALGTSAIAWSDLFLGSGAVITWNSAPSTADLTLTHSAETLTFAGGTIALGTATATGGLTGNITGNVSGTAATVTGAAQAAITSLGTLTTLTVDDITINGNTISSAGASTLAINPTAGQAITFDGTITLDAGVIAGATSITSTTFVGALTGTASGNLVSGGALGTPSSATLTNATGLPIAGLTASTVTALGVGSIELGHASDTTIARVSAGVASIEGKNIYVAGGTDVAFADGGTGLSSWTQYLIPYAATTTSIGQIAIGTSGQVLTSNGAGAAPTFQAAAGGGSYTTVTRSLSAADIIAMGGSPIELIAAPGANKIIMVNQLTVSMNYNSAQFTGGGTLQIRQGTAGTTMLTGPVAAVINGAADFVRTYYAVINTTMAANTSVTVSTAGGANFADGNSTIELHLTYYTMDI